MVALVFMLVANIRTHRSSFVKPFKRQYYDVPNRVSLTGLALFFNNLNC